MQLSLSLSLSLSSFFVLFLSPFLSLSFTLSFSLKMENYTLQEAKNIGGFTGELTEKVIQRKLNARTIEENSNSKNASVPRLSLNSLHGIYVCICMCTCTCKLICIFVRADNHNQKSTSVHVCMCVCLRARICMHIFGATFTPERIFM